MRLLRLKKERERERCSSKGNTLKRSVTFSMADLRLVFMLILGRPRNKRQEITKHAEYQGIRQNNIQSKEENFSFGKEVGDHLLRERASYSGVCNW